MEADVIRWTESVFERRGQSRKARALNIGERRVTGEVKEDAGGWVRVLVRQCEVLTEKTTRRFAPLPKGQDVHRKRRTIERGKPERLQWSDKSARAALASRFLSSR